MVYKEDDIRYERLNWKQFEELCFDLLLKYQFHDLNWRQGGSDKGRDIEAIYTATNALLGAYQEKWFVECKHYSKGIPVSEISEKLDWAEASDVQHFLLVTNKYVSRAAQEYIADRKKKLSYKITILDGKNLKPKILAFPDLVVKYFADDMLILVQNILKQWLFYDILPDIKILSKLREIVEPAKLNKDELVFLWYAYLISDYDEDLLDFETEPFDFDFILPNILGHKNSELPIQYDVEGGDHEVKWSSTGYQNISIKGTDISIFTQNLNFEDQDIQILFKRKQGLVQTKIACKTRT
jgi:hypothetical protein